MGSTGYAQDYQNAQRAYIQGNYEDAAAIIDRLAESYPNDPSVCLLRGHVYCGLQQYDIARDQYQAVIHLTNDAEYVNYANDGLTYVEQFIVPSAAAGTGTATNGALSDAALPGSFTDDEFADPSFSENAFSDSAFSDIDADFVSTIDAYTDPFSSSDSANGTGGVDNPVDLADFTLDDENSPASSTTGLNGADVNQSEFEADNPFSFADEPYTANPGDTDINPFGNQAEFDNVKVDADGSFTESFDDLEIPPLEDFSSPAPSTASSSLHFDLGASEDETLFMGDDFVTSETEARDLGSFRAHSYSSPHPDAGTADAQTFANHSVANDSADEPIDFSDFEDADSNTYADHNTTARPSNVDFLDEFDEFDDLGSLPDFDVSDNSVDFTTPSIGSVDQSPPAASTTFDLNDSGDSSLMPEDDVFSIAGASELPAFTQTNGTMQPEVSVEQGWLAPLENAPLSSKKWIIAGITGVVSAVTVAGMNFAFASSIPRENRATVLPHMTIAGLAMSATAGLASFGVTAALGGLLTQQARRTAADLQTQFSAISQGNLNAKATVYSEDELVVV